MRKHLAALLALACLSAPASAARAAGWEFAGWHGGGCYPDLLPDTAVEGRLYLTSDVAGVWRSEDRGERWSQINRGLGSLHVACLASASGDPRTLYAATKNGLYRSEDAGDRWTLSGRAADGFVFKRPQSYKAVAVSASDPDRVVAGTATGEVLYSADGGRSWSPLSGTAKPLGSADPITAVVWARGEDTFFIAGERGLAGYSFDRPGWTLYEAAPKGIADLALDGERSEHLYAAAGDALWLSGDRGKSWRRLVRAPRGKMQRLAVSRSGSVILAGWNDAWSGGILRSEDGGESWRDPVRKMFADAELDPTRVWAGTKGRTGALRFDPFEPRTLYRTDWWGVWRSDDGGAVWREKIAGAPNTVGSDLVFSQDGRYLYAATMDGGLLRSPDGGGVWEAVFPRKGYEKSVQGHVWRILALPRRVIATSSPWDMDLNQIVIVEPGERARRVERGLAGAKPKVNTMWERGYPRALASAPDGTLYLGVDGDDGGGLFRSLDGGESWQRSAGQPGSKRVYNALAVDPKDPDRIYWGAYGERGGVWVSEDAGGTWTRTLHWVDKIFDLAVSADGTVYAGGSQDGAVLYFSKDRGMNWTFAGRFMGKGTCEALTPHPSDPAVIAMGAVRWDGLPGERVLISLDAGKTWKDLQDGLPEGRGPAAMCFSPDGEYLYMIRYAGSAYRIRWKEAAGPA